VIIEFGSITASFSRLWPDRDIAAMMRGSVPIVNEMDFSM
jgi:hypothetical protein